MTPSPTWPSRNQLMLDAQCSTLNARNFHPFEKHSRCFSFHAPLLILALLFSVAMGTLSLKAQDAPATPPAAPAPVAGGAAPGGETKVLAEKETLWQVIVKGGWIMVPLALISMWCVALIAEGFIRIRLVKFVPVDLLQPLKQAFAEENFQQAWRICKGKSTFLTNVLCKGLERIGRGRTACETAIADYSLKESLIYRTRISYLSTIGVVSPMVGLLGTVTGMIKAFSVLGKEGIANPAHLAAAIGEVLVATATGLIVAIPAFFLYYFFRNRLQKITVLAEDVVHQLMGDIKYEELEGVKIGEGFETELSGGEGGTAAPQAPVPGEQRVSQVIKGVSHACPNCNASISAGSPQCGSCGTVLQWT